MATIELTSENFEETVINNDIVVVDFWASWCGPCRAFAPIMEAASEKHTDICFAKVNTEKERDLAAHFEIRSIPTIMIFREQVGLFSQPGALPEDALEQLIKAIREVDMEEVRRQVSAQSEPVGDA